MSQFGAATVITDAIKLILLDCFETLVQLDGGTYHARPGVVEFLAYHARQPGRVLAVASDCDEQRVRSALAEAGLLDAFAGVYHAGNAVDEDAEGRLNKRLDVPMRDFAARPEQVAFIGDSPLDADAARRYGVLFIRVPRSEDRSFSFATLIAGPSKYNSVEFSAAFLERYLAAQKKPKDSA